MPYRVLEFSANTSGLSVEVPVTRSRDLRWPRSSYMNRILDPVPAAGMFRAEVIAVMSEIEVHADNASSDAPVISREIEDMVRQMQAVRTDREAAVELLKRQLSAVPGVAAAYANRTTSGLDVWVLVDEPYLDNEDLVLAEIRRVRRQFHNVFIDFLVLPSTPDPTVRPSGDVEVLVSR